MYNSLQLASRYVKYWLTASNSKGHGMHSPFVFHFILNVLNNRQDFHPPAVLQKMRQQLEKDETVLHINDMGAGSRNKSRVRTVKQLAVTAVKPRKYSDLLYRLVRYYQPSNIIELGTSLGLTTAHMAMAAPNARITTIEGSEEIKNVALKNFRQLHLDNVTLLNGHFDYELPLVLSGMPTIDMFYVDGNHLYHPTMRYFRDALDKVHNGSVLIFDDIHWSAEMEKAWSEIKAHRAVKCTVDLFFMGIVFFRDEFREKQHFVIRY